MRTWTRSDNIVLVNDYEAAWTDDAVDGTDANTLAQFIVDACNAAEQRDEPSEAGKAVLRDLEQTLRLTTPTD